MAFIVLFESIIIIGVVFFISNIKIYIKNILVCLFLIIFPVLLLFIYISQIISIIFLVTATILFFYTITKSSLIILDVLIVFGMGIFSDNLSQLMVSKLFPSFDIPVFVFSLFIMLFVGVALVYKHYIRSKIVSFQIPPALKWFLLFNGTITLAVFYLNLFFMDTQTNEQLVKINFFLQIVYIGLLLLAGTLLFYNLSKEKEMKGREMAQQQHSEYMQALEKVNRDMQKFRHDYVNILLSLREFVDDGDMKGLKHYFYESILPIEQDTLIENKLIGQLGKIKIPELKGLLASKLLYASHVHIPIDLEIPQPIKAIEMDIIDVTRIMGILLDNAIEASQEVDDPKVHLALFQSEHETLIILENYFNTQNFDITSLFEQSFSTKGEGRGIGLATVRELLHSYPNAVINTRVEQQRFIQEIQIGGSS